MASSTPQWPLETEVSTRSVFFTAWTAAALFGRGLHLWAVGSDDRGDPVGVTPDRRAAQTPDSDTDLDRFRQVTRQLALSESQQARVDHAVSQLQPLIVQLRSELREKQQTLAALQPTSVDFVYDSGRLSNNIGTLATQLALTSSKLKTDVYTVLTAAQRFVLDELRIAFKSYVTLEKRNDIY